VNKEFQTEFFYACQNDPFKKEKLIKIFQKALQRKIFYDKNLNNTLEKNSEGGVKCGQKF